MHYEVMGCIRVVSPAPIEGIEINDSRVEIPDGTYFETESKEIRVVGEKHYFEVQRTPRWASILGDIFAFEPPWKTLAIVAGENVTIT